MPKEPELQKVSKGAIVGRALGFAVGVFFFAVTLFVVGVIIAAKFATKIK